MKIIGYEIRKNYLKRYLIVIIFAFTLVNVISIYGYYETSHVFSTEKDDSWSKAFWDLYEENYKGEITIEKINRLMEIYSPLYQACVVERTFNTEYDPDTFTGYEFGDYRMLDLGFVRPMEYAYTYREKALEIANNAKQNMIFFSSIDNVYQYRSSLKIASLYEGRQINNFYNTEMYDNLFSYDFSSFLILLTVIVAIVPVFVAEKETEMNLILSISKKGGKKTVRAKIASACFFVTGICIWFTITDFFAFAAFFGLTGLTNNLYALRDFMLTPLDITMWEYIIVSAGVKILGMQAVSAVILFISSLFKKALLPYVISLGALFSMMLADELATTKHFNPFDLIVNRELFRHTNLIRIMDFPVHEYVGVILSVALFFGVFILTTIRVNKNNAWLTGGRR